MCQDLTKQEGFAWGTEEVVTCMVDVATYGTVRSTEQTTVALP